MDRGGLEARCKVDDYEGDFINTSALLFLPDGESTSMKMSIGPPAVLATGNLSFDLFLK